MSIPNGSLAPRHEPERSIVQTAWLLGIDCRDIRVECSNEDGTLKPEKLQELGARLIKFGLRLQAYPEVDEAPDGVTVSSPE